MLWIFFILVLVGDFIVHTSKSVGVLRLISIVSLIYLLCNDVSMFWLGVCILVSTLVYMVENIGFKRYYDFKELSEIKSELSKARKYYLKGVRGTDYEICSEIDRYLENTPDSIKLFEAQKIRQSAKDVYKSFKKKENKELGVSDLEFLLKVLKIIERRNKERCHLCIEES